MEAIEAISDLEENNGVRNLGLAILSFTVIMVVLFGPIVIDIVLN